MNTKNLALAACAALALGALTAGDAAAQQCRFGGGNSGYRRGGNGYNTGVHGYGYNTSVRGYGNNYNAGSRYNNRINPGYDAPLGYNGYSNNQPSRAPGLGYNRGYDNSRYNAGYDNASTRYGRGYCGNNIQQPVAYRHGDHIDVGGGYQRYHITGRGY